MPGQKLCTKCRTEQPIENFRERAGKARRTKKNGEPYRQSWCKRCMHQEAKNYPTKIYTKAAINANRKGEGLVTGAEIRTLGLPEENICYLCGDRILTREDAELDHIFPRSKGGLNHIQNLAWTHKGCNRLKHDLSVEELIPLMRKILNNLT